MSENEEKGTKKNESEPKNTYEGKGNAYSKVKDDDGAFGAIVALILIASFIVLMIVASANTEPIPMTAKGTISGSDDVVVGQNNMLTYQLPQDAMFLDDEDVVWYVDGKEVQRKMYGDKSALSYGLTNTELGNRNVRVEVGNRHCCDYTVNVHKPRVSITIPQYSITYGDKMPKFEYKVNGLSDNYSHLVKVDNVTCDCNNSEIANVGYYKLSAKATQTGEKYELNVVEGYVEVMPKTLYIANDFSKVYDGRNTLDYPVIELEGILAGDEVFATCDRVYFDNKNAGENKCVTTYNIVLSGKDANNYCLSTNGAVGKILPRQLLIADGNAKSIVNGVKKVSDYKLMGIVEGDIVGIGSIDSYSKNITTLPLVGRDKDNYQVVMLNNITKNTDKSQKIETTPQNIPNGSKPSQNKNTDKTNKGTVTTPNKSNVKPNNNAPKSYYETVYPDLYPSKD